MKTIFLDIDTQIDFLFPAGALYVPGAERLVPALARLNHYAASHSILLVSTVDAHAENDPEFKVWPPHCIAGAQGQRKPASLLVDAGQIVYEKQQIDFFPHPNFARLLAGLNADRYVVYGVVTEYCVASALRGLVKTGKPVELVTDAIQGIDPAAARHTISDFLAAPTARLTNVAEITRQ
jgi:nicotinamidase/pyrazinamidase